MIPDTLFRLPCQVVHGAGTHAPQAKAGKPYFMRLERWVLRVSPSAPAEKSGLQPQAVTLFLCLPDKTRRVRPLLGRSVFCKNQVWAGVSFATHRGPGLRNHGRLFTRPFGQAGCAKSNCRGGRVGTSLPQARQEGLARRMKADGPSKPLARGRFWVCRMGSACPAEQPQVLAGFAGGA